MLCQSGSCVQKHILQGHRTSSVNQTQKAGVKVKFACHDSAFLFCHTALAMSVKSEL